MENYEINEILTWISKFSTCLKKNDNFGLKELFHEDSFWRDIVSFTWNIKTAEGKDQILEMINKSLLNTNPIKWITRDDLQLKNDVIGCSFDFQTNTLKGEGFIRLKHGKCWTLFTSALELKCFEEKKNYSRPMGVEHGTNKSRKSWLEIKEEESTLGLSKQPYCLIIGGGQGGIILAARLRKINVPTIVIDKNKNPGDSWRNRYKSLKPQTVIPSLDSRIRIESTLTKLIEKWSLKERNKSSNRTSELKRYRTLLRIYLLADYCALRREEIWSLPLEHIDLSNRIIHIKPVDADGGTNKDGNKIRVKFNSKSNRPDFVIMEDYVYKFLSEDLKSRDLKKEVWYLDKGDGSNWFASRDGLTKAMTRLKKDLGVEGKPCHGFREARNEDLFDENPYHGKEHLRHADIQTTTQHYTSEKKSAGLINSLNKTTKKRHSVSS